MHDNPGRVTGNISAWITDCILGQIQHASNHRSLPANQKMTSGPGNQRNGASFHSSSPESPELMHKIVESPLEANLTFALPPTLAMSINVFTTLITPYINLKAPRCGKRMKVAQSRRVFSQGSPVPPRICTCSKPPINQTPCEKQHVPALSRVLVWFYFGFASLVGEGWRGLGRAA